MLAVRESASIRREVSPGLEALRGDIPVLETPPLPLIGCKLLSCRPLTNETPSMGSQLSPSFLGNRGGGEAREVRSPRKRGAWLLRSGVSSFGCEGFRVLGSRV